ITSKVAPPSWRNAPQCSREPDERRGIKSASDAACSCSLRDPHLIPPPFRGRKERVVCAAFHSTRWTSGLLIPPPKRGRDGVGVAIRPGPVGESETAKRGVEWPLSSCAG